MLTHLGHLLLVNDWSLGFCLMVAASVYRFLKLSIHVALLTHFGVIPPLNEIFAMLKP